jgi:LacI family transcriptional regulator
MEKKPTVKDIAELAGVSATAVSMALKNNPRISEKTRERILAIAKKLHYRPNYAARSLIGGQSHTIGLVITSIINPFYPELAKGIEDKAMESGYNIILCSTNYDPRLQDYFIDILRSKGVDGIIFSSVGVSDPHVKRLVDEGFPFVLVNRRVLDPSLEDRIDYVVLDNFAGGYMAAEHILNLGHRRIAVVAGSFSASTARERIEGTKKALADRGLELDNELIAECDFSKEKAYEATGRLLSLTSPPTAILAQNDFMALGVRDAVLERGLGIPSDVALVGFDDIEAASIRGVEITTINQKKYEMGALAVEILTAKIENRDNGASVKHVVLKPEIIIRKSCGYAAGKRRD